MNKYLTKLLLLTVIFYACTFLAVRSACSICMTVTVDQRIPLCPPVTLKSAYPCFRGLISLTSNCNIIPNKQKIDSIPGKTIYGPSVCSAS